MIWGVTHLRKPRFQQSFTKTFLKDLCRQHPLVALLEGTHHCVEAAQLRPPGRDGLEIHSIHWGFIGVSMVSMGFIGVSIGKSPINVVYCPIPCLMNGGYDGIPCAFFFGT